MGIVSMGVYVATVVLIAYLWVFPVPFGIVLGIGPCLVVFFIVLILTIGPKTFKSNPGLQFYVLATEAIIAVIYPAFSSVYLQASANDRAGLVLLLPVIELVMKNIVAWASSHLEDCIPVIAVFSIEVFNALYVATCMQATKSTLATIVIIAFDVVNGALAFHSLLGRTHLLQQHHQISQVFDSNGKKYASKDLIPTVMMASQHLRTFQTKKGKMIRIRSPMKLGLGAEAERLLDSLTHHQHIFPTRGTRKTSRTTSRTGTRTHSPVRVHTEPTPAFPVPLNMRELSLNPAILHVEPSHEERNLELVESTLQLLFHCEYHALVEYVECAVPILFGLYLTILCQLPRHKFYPHTQEMVPGQLEGMLKSLSIYVTLEVLSFVVMHVALKQKFKLSALYQLAFVLETHVVQLRSRLFVWIVFILRFTLQHYGVDFSFQFAWVSSRTQ